jgi:photosystem II Psb27 protein
MLSRRTFASILIPGFFTFSNFPSVAGIFGTITEEEYKKDTMDLVGLAKEVSVLPKDDVQKGSKVGVLKETINTWVSKYRRQPKFAGRPSFSNMYSAVNALSGHFNNFGPTAPSPKKRLDRLLQELEQSSFFVAKGR